MDKYINIVILLLLGVLAGFNIFLTFILGPALFSNFNPRLAGEIMNTIFPFYFSTGWIIGLSIYTLIAVISIKNKQIINTLKVFIIALSILIISYMALHKSILPMSQATINQYYSHKDENQTEKAQEFKQKFKTLHKISSIMNLINLLLIIFLFYNYYINRCENKTENKNKVVI